MHISNPDYSLVLNRLHLYYDMQLVTFNIDKDMNLVIQSPVFSQPYTQKPLVLYQLETVPVPILERNNEAQSYMYLQVKKPYIALNSETYICLRHQELRSCKRIGHEFYCEELFVVKHKSSYSCESDIYFNLTTDIIKIIIILIFTSIRLMLPQPYWIEVMKWYWQIGPVISI